VNQIDSQDSFSTLGKVNQIDDRDLFFDNWEGEVDRRFGYVFSGLESGVDRQL
jgi:hypothetical protein